ncbi:uroporphyrinogen-III synthase [Ectopseudomonas mendocina]|uniref:Uroporphyrinogen-III synthase n=1 Tax=Ectopseudomonas mendocina TaxID=300 RepID=A0ABZ2REV9_ECTME
MRRWRLLLTRPTQDSAELALTLVAQGVYSCSLPLLAIEPLAETEQQRQCMAGLDRYAAVIVVSKPAATLGIRLMQRCLAQNPAGPRWFTVGAATAKILTAQGLAVYFPAHGDDSEALLAMPQLQQALAGQVSPRVLIMRGDTGRELLAQRLGSQGVQVDYLPLYRRVMPVYPAGELARRVAEESLNGLVVSSGQGFEHLRELAGDAWPELSRLTLFVPSPRVAELAKAAGAQTVVDCRGASAAALLAALHNQPVADL